MRWSESRARDYVGSFEEPITARISRPGEVNLRYFDGPEGSGNFVTKNEFFSSVDAYKGLYLAPSKSNMALSRQTVTTQQRSIVFEGNVREGASLLSPI